MITVVVRTPIQNSLDHELATEDSKYHRQGVVQLEVL